MNVFRIFRRDLRRIGRNAMALVVAAGVALLPALYAWFNIAANWDPYGSTGGIQVAVACEDTGASLEGFPINIGEQTITNLKGNDQIGWQFVTREEALSGVERGDYYAGIVIPADFSERLVSILTGEPERPCIEYYINEKKNAIAPKITDKGVTAVQQQINEAFSTQVTQAVVAGLGAAIDTADGRAHSLGDRILERVQSADESLARISATLDVLELAAQAADELNHGSQALLPAAGSMSEAGTQAAGGLASLLDAAQTASLQTVDSLDELLGQALAVFDAAGGDTVEALRRLEAHRPGMEEAQDNLSRLAEQLAQSAGALEEAAGGLSEPGAGEDSLAAARVLRALAEHIGTLQADVERAAGLAGQLEDGPLRQSLLATGQQAAALAQDTLTPLLEAKRQELTATHPPESFREYTPQQKRLAAEISALSAGKKAAEGLAGLLSDENLPSAGALGDALQSELEQLAGEMGQGRATLERLAALARTLPSEAERLADGLERAAGLMQSVSELTLQAADALEQGAELPYGMAGQLESLIAQADSAAADARAAAADVRPALEASAEQACASLDAVTSLLNQAGSVLPQAGAVLEQLAGALSSTTQSLSSAQALVDAARSDLQALTSRLESVESDQRLAQLAGLLQGDAAAMGEFMAAPVQVETHSLYPIANYGSAMAAFYSILACWVGGVVLVAIFRVQVDEDDQLQGLHPWEHYLGRYLLFLLFGLVQSLIICLGDLYFLGIQCTSIPLFLLGGCTASFVFTLIIYTLTVSFGDVGKALAVILLVIQIAGSGGTFPIEVTPAFFQRIYPVLPFTHAINAMREVIAGPYGAAYWLDLLKLLGFVPPALALGLVLRRPLIRMNAFFEERLESTHLM